MWVGTSTKWASEAISSWASMAVKKAPIVGILVRLMRPTTSLTSAGSASRPKIIGPWMALGTKIPAPIRGARDATPITKDSSGIGRRPCTEAAVPTRTVPRTRRPKSAWRDPAYAMIVIPPMEWPTSTSGESPGTVAAMTSARSSPSSRTVAFGGRPMVESPWPRWSYVTTRTAR